MLFIPIIFLLSCASTKYSKLNEEIHIKKGMSFEEVQKANKKEVLTDKELKNENISNPKEFKIRNLTFEVYFKELHTSYKVVSRSSVKGDGSTINAEIPVYTKYFYIFKNKKIIWWGFLYELKNENDEDLLELAESLENYYRDIRINE